MTMDKNVRRETQDVRRAVEQTQLALGEMEQALDAGRETEDAYPVRDSGDGLPEGWAPCLVGDYLFLKNGYAFKSSMYVEAQEGSYPIIRISDVDGKEASDLKAIHVLEENIVEGFEVENGDLLIAMSGATTGKVGVYKGKKAYQNQRVGNLKLHAEKLGNASYRNYLIANLSPDILKAAYGGAQPNISGKAVEGLTISLPPLAEQTVIAQTLDTLLAQVDNIKTRLDAIPNILKTFRQSVLAAAVSGKLTEAWRGENECEEAKDLLEKLKSSRKAKLEREIEGGDKETKRLLGKILKHEFSEPDEDIPNGWIWTSFMDSMERVVDCHNKTAPYIESGIPLIRTPDIRNGKISLEGARYISEETYQYWSRRCPPDAGDIIFTREAPMGEAGVVPEEVRLCMGQRMMLLRPMSEYLNPKYVLLNILSLNFQVRMEKEAIGTGVKHLRVAGVEALTYPLCSLEEQTEIVRRVEELFAFADQIEQQVINAQGRVNNLTQSILAKAFRGELTAQWRADNPDLISGENSAEALLTKIQEERDALKKSSKPKKKSTANKFTKN